MRLLFRTGCNGEGREDGVGGVAAKVTMPAVMGGEVEVGGGRKK